MKSTFKQKINFLKNPYFIIGIVSILLFLSFIFCFAYNLNKGILASEEDSEEEEIKYELLKCGREIPVGEAMEKTGELLEEIIIEFERIKTNSYNLIRAQQEMEELAKKCSMKNCTPVCEEVPIYDVWGGEPLYYQCLRQPCEGNPCDKEEIEKSFSEITNLSEEIQAAKEKLYKLIYEEVEPLCIKENEDIRTNVENAQCKLNPLCREKALEIREWIESRLPESLQSLANWLKGRGLDPCPLIKPQKAIGRKLDLSRAEFDKCYLSPEDIEKVFLGEKTGKYLLSCQRVEKENHPRYTKTEIEVEGEKIPVCTSPYNWFCCLDVSQ